MLRDQNFSGMTVNKMVENLFGLLVLFILQSELLFYCTKLKERMHLCIKIGHEAILPLQFQINRFKSILILNHSDGALCVLKVFRSLFKKENQKDQI